MKKRIISAAIALAIVIPLLILGGISFYIGVGAIGLIGYYELIRIKDAEKKIPMLVKIIMFLSFSILMISSVISTYGFTIDYKIIAAILIISLLPLNFYAGSYKYTANDAFYLIGITVFLGIGFNSLISVRDLGINYFVYILLITTMSDTFAFLIGTQIGKHKLCPKVSPNKSIEGMVAGTVLGTFVGTVFFITAFSYSGSLINIILITLFLSLIAQLGDLTLSAIKRNYGVKDFGNIMPGHGGVLDRVDSLLFACLAFSFIMSLI